MRVRYLLIAGAVLLAAGCAAQQDEYQRAFNPTRAVEGSSQSFAQPEAAVWPVALATLAKQGFTVSSANEQAGVITATRLIQDPNDSELSYHIDATVTVIAQDVRPSEQHTQVSLAANEQTIRHQKYHTWWHLLWIVPLFPTGTEYNTVVRHEQTVTDPQFYSDFFADLKSRLTAKAA